jgi:hypothetical protein
VRKIEKPTVPSSSKYTYLRIRILESPRTLSIVTLK